MYQIETERADLFDINMMIAMKYGKYEIIDFWFVPPVVSYGKNIIGMVTVGDTLNISFQRYAE